MGLSKPNVMGLGRRAAAHDAWLVLDKLTVLPVAQANSFRRNATAPDASVIRGNWRRDCDCIFNHSDKWLPDRRFRIFLPAPNAVVPEGIKYAIRFPANRVLQERIGHLLTRPVGRPPNEVRRSYANFTHQAETWTKPRRVVAKVECHPGELYPRGGFIVTNMARPPENCSAARF